MYMSRVEFARFKFCVHIDNPSLFATCMHYLLFVHTQVGYSANWKVFTEEETQHAE